MEIKDYLRAIRRWLWLPIALPIVAALVAALILESQPAHFEADATVIVPAVSARGFSTSAAAQYVATFKDVLVSTPVVDKVAADTHVPVKDLVGGLSADTITASSNIIHVTYLGYKGQNVTDVVKQASSLTLDTVAQPQLVQAENAVVAAQNQLQQANAAITNFTTQTGQINPTLQFNTQEQQLNTLTLELQQAQIAGDSARATALQSVITQRQQQLAKLSQQLAQYNSLVDAQKAGLTVRDHAAQELNDAQALLAADHNPSTVVAQDLGRVSRLSNTLKFTVIAFVVALILALAFILLMELMQGARRVEQERPQAREVSPALRAVAPEPDGGMSPWRTEEEGTPLFGQRRMPRRGVTPSLTGSDAYGDDGGERAAQGEATDAESQRVGSGAG
jgi:hypothetical protein